jgi:hypothetical protein
MHRAHCRSRSRPNTWQLPLWLAFAGTLAGCGVQLSAGMPTRSVATSWPLTASLGGRIVPTRSHGVFAGGDVQLQLHGRPGVRQVFGTFGYRATWHPTGMPWPQTAVLELGADMGVGQAAYEDWTAPSFYVGAQPALLLRVFGNQDVASGYSVVSLLFDLVLFGRAGVWGSPEDRGRELFEASIQIAARITAISDAVVSSNDNWVPR